MYDAGFYEVEYETDAYDRWYSRYSDKVSMMNRQAEKINKAAKTIIRKPTPDELAFYNLLMQPKECYLLKMLKEKLKMSSIMMIRLVTPRDVSDFVDVASSCPSNISVTASHEGYKVDAKSIMGVYSLNLSEPILITLDGDGHDTYFERFSKWRITE